MASDEAIRVGKKKLVKAEKRLGELNRIFMRLYEDRVNDTISDERFAAMSSSYEDEQAERKKKVDALICGLHPYPRTDARRNGMTKATPFLKNETLYCLMTPHLSEVPSSVRTLLPFPTGTTFLWGPVLRGFFSFHFPFFGKITVNAAPWPGALFRSMAAPWTWAACLTMDSPSPVPGISLPRLLSPR